MLFRIVSVLFALMITPALAQETGGVLTGTLNGQAVEWKINPLQSDFSGFAGTRMISLHATPKNVPENVGVLTIVFETFNNNASNPEIVLFKAKGSSIHMAREDNAEITLTHEDEDNGFLTLKGSIVAKLAATTTFGRTFDMNDTIDLEIDFSSIVEVLGH